MNHAVTFSVAPVLAVFDDDFNTQPLTLFAAPFTLAFWLPCWLYAWLMAAAPVIGCITALFDLPGWRTDLHRAAWAVRLLVRERRLAYAY